MKISPSSIDQTIHHSNTPFNNERMSSVFKVSSQDLNRLSTRENSWLEFKEAFNWGSREKYAKTIAAFANTKGGYIVFGVGDKPRILKGLHNNNFETFDTKDITEFLNEHFSPEIYWDMGIHSFQGMNFGIIYVHESAMKPVIAKNNYGQTIKEADIFYRYRGRTERIKYSELRDILDEICKKEQEYWMEHIKQIATLGHKRVALLDLDTGLVRGKGNTFLIDENLLSKIQFIREGEFNETKGSPTLKLIGKVEPMTTGLIKPVKEIFRTYSIHAPDIITSFLDQKIVDDPKQYLRQVCFETTSFLPVYYFIWLAGLKIEEAIEFVSNSQSTSQSSTKLLERLHKKISCKLPIPQTQNESSKRKIKHYEDILKSASPELSTKDDIRYFLQATRSIGRNDIDKKYILPIIKYIYEQYYTDRKAKLADELRRCLCHLDTELFDGKLSD